MKGILAKLTLVALFVSTIFSARAAEEVTFNVSAPMMVAVGEAFRVEFALNAIPESDSFVAPSFAGFDVLAGPAVSRGQSMSIVNGSMTKSVNYTITYVLMANSEGNLVIEPARAVVDDKTYTTRSTPIEVAAQGASQPSGGAGSASAAQGASPEGAVAKDDVLLRVIPSRTSLFRGEPLRLTFKLYHRADIAALENVKFPVFNGFWSQDIETQSERQREKYAGKIYETVVLKEYLLYPQQSGTLTIDPAQITALVQVVVRNNNYDPFFGGGASVANVRRQLTTDKLNITVKPLPAGAPANFSGAVGQFEMNTSLPPKQISANSSETYTVKISGRGNLTFIQPFKLDMPNSFETYNVKTTESIQSSVSGSSGYRQFEYPFIARAEGQYEVNGVEFVYFDPSRMEYVALKSPVLELNVMPDSSVSGSDEPIIHDSTRASSKEQVRMLGDDIRFIKLGNAKLNTLSAPLFMSNLYICLVVVILVLGCVAYLMLRRRIRDSKNVVMIRGRRASKVAVQRFHAANKYMQEGQHHAFYKEMLSALWGYMSDRFNIPVAHLTKESVRVELQRRGVSVELIERFIMIISTCDEEQYSPLATAQMSEVYADGVDIISRVESVIKK